MNSFKTVFALALVSVASAGPIHSSQYEHKVQHNWNPWTPMKQVSETLQSDWTPIIKQEYAPAKQAYAPAKQTYAPAKQAYVPTIKLQTYVPTIKLQSYTPVIKLQAYTPPRHSFAPVKHAYTPVKQAHAPVKQAHAPAKQAFVPVQHVFVPVKQPYAAVPNSYAPIQYTKGLGSYGTEKVSHLESYEHGGSGYEAAQDGGYTGAQDEGYEAYSHGDTVEIHGFGEAQDAGYEAESHEHGGAEAAHDDGHVHKDYHAHPAYKFEYGVKDPKTGDHKSQWEHRDGDKVIGEYSLDEADGTKRVVSYTADKKNGFQAVVKKIGHALHIIH